MPRQTVNSFSIWDKIGAAPGAFLLPPIVADLKARCGRPSKRARSAHGCADASFWTLQAFSEPAGFLGRRRANPIRAIRRFKD
jgi:hypothetical protein